MSALQEQVASADEVRAKLAAVLAREEFAPKSSWLAETWKKTLDRLGDWLGEIFGIVDPATRRSVVIALLALLGAAILAAIVVRLARFLRARPASPAGGGSVEDLRAAGVAALRRDARAAAARGDRLAALRLYFRALVVGLSERGQLEYKDAWTNRELLARGAPRREVAPVLASLVPRLDAQSFGREPALPEDVELLSSLCERLLDGRRA